MTTAQAKISQWRDNLVPHIVDHLAQETPEAVFAEYPKSKTTYEHGFRKVTYRNLANAINGAAKWLSDTLGGPSYDHEVLSYIGPNDVRYTVFVLAAIKAGYVLFLTSPRNSVAAQGELFKRLKCTKLLSPEPAPAPVAPILDAHTNIQAFTVPIVEDLLDTEHPHYAFNKTFKDAKSEPFMIVHTSGSTGFPKPIIYTHQVAARHMSSVAVDPPAGRTSLDRLIQGKRVINFFPPFHAAGIVTHLCVAIPFGTTMIGPLSGSPPSAQGLFDALHHTSADIAFLVPSIILELSQKPDLLDYCSQKVTRCLYAGGDLPQQMGDTVHAKLPLQCHFGASEVGLTPQLLPDNMGPQDWKYVEFHPETGVSFREIADGASELCFVRDSARDDIQPVFALFPELDFYGTRDLWVPHATIPNYWTWRARADDIIVFLNGEKTNPISMEQYIVAQNREVISATVVGAQRFQAALLVEPAPTHSPKTTAEEAAFIEKIWPSIEEANKLAPAHARVEKTMVLPMKLDKPALRSGKMTVQKAGTLALYSAEIDKLYQDADMGADETTITNGLASVDIEDISQVSKLVSATLAQVSDQSGVDEDADFFAMGFDSLQALTLARKLRQSLHLPGLATATVYSNPSVTQLSKAILSIHLSKQASQDLEQQNRTQAIALTLKAFGDQVRKLPPSSSKAAKPAKSTVVLTGSTGALGTYLLDVLLADTDVNHVYCLNRRSDGQTVQKQRNEAAGLANHTNGKKVTYIKADLAQANLGLSEEIYDSIRDQTTLIIHNAWPVNFNLALETFQPHLHGLVNLFSLSASAHYRPQVFFVSSISSVLGLRTLKRVTREEVISATNAPYGNGYAESKYISENLCEVAAHQLHLPVSTARVGQIAGPINRPGIWNPAEYIPSLIKSSSYMGILPDSIGASLNRVDWMPIDLLAETIVDLLVHQSEPGLGSGAEVYHLQNPSTTTWKAVVPSFQSAIESTTSKPCKVVPAKDWLIALRQSLESIKDEAELETLLEQSPAAKLLDFFSTSMSDTEGTNMLDQQKTLARSAPLKAMGQISDAWIRKWVAEWNVV